MKAFVVAAIVLVVAVITEAKLTDEQKALVAQRSKDCRTESGVDEAVVVKSRKGEIADDPKLREHIFCMSKKSGFQNDAGVLQIDVLKKKLGDLMDNPEEAAKLVDKCSIQKESPQDTAVDTVKCYFKNSPTPISLF